ncbi:kinase-like domain-containing protein [Dissophora ornata]|nr:kinase-like domain-containing protein [Dissophora ornata]
MLRTRCKDLLSNRDSSQQPPSPSSSLGTIFSIQEIRSIMRTVVLGAQALHKEGYSHKDIKPANILFREGQGLLCDFGLCSKVDELPQNQFFGTQDYASPEARRVGGQRRCDYIQGDVYSLGAVLYELATGSVLSKVIGQGLNWQKVAFFGGWSFSELLQGMVNDIEKRWDIDQVVASRFWDESPSAVPSSCSPCPSSAFGAETGPRQVNPAEIDLPITPMTSKTPTDEGTFPE